jgi:hypothetical protein
MIFRELFEWENNNKLVLPDFQRDYEWKAENIKKIISSFLVRLPIGSLVILEGKNNDFKSRKLCFRSKTPLPKEECYYLLDGQQRLAALKVVFSDLYKTDNGWMEQWDNTYSQLRSRWFVRVIPEENEEDIFGWRTLNFPGFLQLEPQDVIDFIHYKPIYKTKEFNRWYHPAYLPNGIDGQPLPTNQLRLNIARKASEESGLVPLYSIYNFVNTSASEILLHEQVLEQVALRRIEELEAAANDGSIDIVKVLEKVEPEISFKKEDKKIIQHAWVKLNIKWVSDIKNYLNELMEQEVHVIKLKSKEISRAISIFENINLGGTKLSVYDIIVAKAARDKDLPSLTQRIMDIVLNPIELPTSLTDFLIGGDSIPGKWSAENIGCIEDNKPGTVLKNQFLNLISIISHLQGNLEHLKTEHIKKSKHLALNHKQINDNTRLTVTSLIRAFAFLQFRCGITNIDKAPYKLMIIPIAYYLGNDDNWNNRSVLAKLEYWYWTSIFGGAYRYEQNDRVIRDMKALEIWFNGGDSFLNSAYQDIFNFPRYSTKEVLLMQDSENEVPGSIHEALLQYILSRQPLDFLPGEPIRLNTWDIASRKECQYKEETFNLSIEDHHIIPLGSATSIGQSSKLIRGDKSHILNSPLNRTYISTKANGLISSKSASDYLSYMNTLSLYGHAIPTPVDEKLEKKQGEEENNYHMRVLSERFEVIKKVLLEEIEQLAEM